LREVCCCCMGVVFDSQYFSEVSRNSAKVASKFDVTSETVHAQTLCRCSIYLCEHSEQHEQSVESFPVLQSDNSSVAMVDTPRCSISDRDTRHILLQRAACLPTTSGLHPLPLTSTAHFYELLLLLGNTVNPADSTFCKLTDDFDISQHRKL
jgi:hypothetical protein